MNSFITASSGAHTHARRHEHNRETKAELKPPPPPLLLLLLLS